MSLRRMAEIRQVKNLKEGILKEVLLVVSEVGWLGLVYQYIGHCQKVEKMMNCYLNIVSSLRKIS